MKNIAGSLRLDLASFRELEAFAQLGTDLDKATQQQLDRGYRMVEVLKQPQFQPMNVVDQVMIIYAGTKGHLDKIERRKVLAWEKQFLRFMAEQRPQVRATVTNMKTWKKGADGKPVHEGLEQAIAAFQPLFKG
jgi:F-type H+-transporting ATPase subunit alpha